MTTPNTSENDTGKETENDENTPTAAPIRRYRSLVTVTIALIAIIALSTSTFLLYRENQSLKVSLDEQTRKTAELQAFILAFEKLTISNITPPVSRIQAVVIALSSGGWNYTSLRGMEVNASLLYCRFWYANNGGELGFEKLSAVKAPVGDYSPRAEYNVTSPWGSSTLGTLWYRYVWGIGVRQSGVIQSLIPADYYYVDASTGEIVPHPWIRG